MLERKCVKIDGNSIYLSTPKKKKEEEKEEEEEKEKEGGGYLPDFFSLPLTEKLPQLAFQPPIGQRYAPILLFQ